MGFSTESTIRALPPLPPADFALTITNASGDSTNYVAQSVPFANIPLHDYNSISVFPRVTQAPGGGAANMIWKFQWSVDGTNWIDDFVDSYTNGGDAWTAAASGERALASTGYATRTFTVAAAYKGAVLKANALAVPKKAPYVRILQKADVAVTGQSIIVDYHISLQ